MMFKYYKDSYKNMLEVSGRTSRKEYVYVVGIDCGITIFYLLLGFILFKYFEIDPQNKLYSFLLSIPLLAFFFLRWVAYGTLQMRRVQDMGYPGGLVIFKNLLWLVTVYFVPFFGWVVPVLFFVYLLRHGSKSDNAYGPAPQTASKPNSSSTVTKEVKKSTPTAAKAEK